MALALCAAFPLSGCALGVLSMMQPASPSIPAPASSAERPSGLDALWDGDVNWRTNGVVSFDLQFLGNPCENGTVTLARRGRDGQKQFAFLDDGRTYSAFPADTYAVTAVSCGNRTVTRELSGSALALIADRAALGGFVLRDGELLDLGTLSVTRLERRRFEIAFTEPGSRSRRAILRDVSEEDGQRYVSAGDPTERRRARAPAGREPLMIDDGPLFPDDRAGEMADSDAFPFEPPEAFR